MSNDTAGVDNCPRCGAQPEDRRSSYCNDCQAYVAVAAELVTQKIAQPNVDKVVDVYCKCQSENEIGIQGLERGGSVKCGRCGSKEIVYEVLTEE